MSSFTKKANANANAKTKKITNLSINANSTLDRYNLFYEYLHGNMLYHDEKNPTYKVTDTMMHDYIKVNNLSEPWITILKENRDLLYIDQFVNFYIQYYNHILKTLQLKKYSLSDIDITNYFNPDTKQNYKLPVLNTVCAGIASRRNATNLSGTINKNFKVAELKLQNVDLYKTDVLAKLKEVLIYPNAFKCNINTEGNGIGILLAHGTPASEFLIVPQNVIIAFITPVNNYCYQESDKHKTLLTLLKDYRTNEHFLKNPACYFRNNNCLKNTVYFYPGQLIPNYEFSIMIGKDIETLGFYTSDETNLRDEIFETTTPIINARLTSLYDLFYIKPEKINNKIIFISCCRKYDIDFKPEFVEFMYRYEHIITYLNMAKCAALALDNKQDISCTSNKTHHFKYPLYNNAKNTEESKLSGLNKLFYDSALSYKFNVNSSMSVEKFKYMLNDYSKIPKFNDKNIELKYSEILRNLLRKYKYANSSKADQQKILTYLFDIIKNNISLFSQEYSLIIYNELQKYVDVIQLFKFVEILNNQNNTLIDKYLSYLFNSENKNSVSDELIYELSSINIKRVFTILHYYKPDEVYNIYKKYFIKKLKDEATNNKNNTKRVYAELKKLFLDEDLYFKYLKYYLLDIGNKKNNSFKNNDYTQEDIIYEACNKDIYLTFDILLEANIFLNDIYIIFKTYFTKKRRETNASVNNSSITESVNNDLIKLYTANKNINNDIKLNLLINLASDFISSKNNENKNNKIDRLNSECKQYYDIPDYINKYYNSLLNKFSKQIDINGTFIMHDYQRIKCMPLLVINLITVIFTYKNPMFDKDIIDDLFKILLNPDNHIDIASDPYKKGLTQLNDYKPELFKNNQERQKLINPT